MGDNQVIYTQEKVEFTIDGQKYDVSTISLGLVTGQIPSCTINIAPANAAGEIRINSLSLISLKDAFTDLSKKATEHVKASLYAKLTSTKEGFPDQEIDIKDWLLVSTGLGEVSTTAEFSLVCVIFHPAVQLQFNSGCFFNGAGTLFLDGVAGKATDPIDAAVQAITATEKANETKIKTLCRSMTTISTPLKDPNVIKEELQKGMSNVKSLIQGTSTSKSLIHWDSTYTKGNYKIPCEDIGEPITYGVKYAMVDAWVPEAGDQNFWGILCSVGGKFYFDIIPTYHEAFLTAAPSNPYGGPSVSMPDDYVYSLDMPGFDPDPLYGVIMYQGQGSSDNSASVTFADMAAAGAAIQPVNIAYIPVKSELSSGRLAHVRDPEWISIAMDAAAGKKATEPRDAAGDSFAQGSGERQDVDNNIKENLYKWNQLRLRLLGTEFMLRYREQMSASMQCALCVKLPDGSEPIPGSVLSFWSGGQKLFGGKIVTVSHQIDCEQSRAVTTIRLAWCDADNGSSNVLGTSPKIPFYDAIEVIEKPPAENGGGSSSRD